MAAGFSLGKKDWIQSIGEIKYTLIHFITKYFLKLWEIMTYQLIDQLNQGQQLSSHFCHHVVRSSYVTLGMESRTHTPSISM